MATKTVSVSKQHHREGSSPLECRHHWLIESPTGPVSRGVCQRCGKIEEFNNVVKDREWQVGIFPELASNDWGDVKVPSQPEEGE